MIFSRSADVTENCAMSSGAPGDMVVAKYKGTRHHGVSALFPRAGHHTEQRMLANYPAGWYVHKTPITCWDIQNIHVARSWVLTAGDFGWLSVRARDFLRY